MSNPNNISTEETLTALNQLAYHYGMSFDEMALLRGISVEEMFIHQKAQLENTTSFE